jgi:hypothetical protein
MDTVGGDIFPPEKVRDLHRSMIQSAGIPKWVLKTCCFKCGKELGPLSIRAIGLRLNASRIGDIAVEVCCEHCSAGYEFYYRNACRSLLDFTEAVKSKSQPSSPVPSMELDVEDNNLLERLIEDHNAQIEVKSDQQEKH